MGEYIVIAGNSDRPDTIMRGTIEKGLGQTAFTEVGNTINRRADIGFPNRTDAWGRRVVRNREGKITKSGKSVDIKDPDYKGEIEFLKWGDFDGQLIVCRYLKGYDTLDYLYQNVVLNADDNLRDDNEASGDAAWIRLTSGDNVIDDNENPMLAQMLKIHDHNESSIYKSPNNNYFLIRDKKFENNVSSETKVLSSKFDALRIVNEAAQDNSFAKLRNLAKIATVFLGENVKDQDLFASLQKVADENPEGLLSLIHEHKKIISNVVEKAKAFKIVDFTKDGTVVATDNNKQTILAEKCPAKGENIIQWMMDDCLDDKAYETAFQLKKITDKIK